MIAAGGINAGNVADYARATADVLVTSWIYFAPPADIEVKLFGGATMIGHPDGRQRQPAVGAMNLAAARKIIKARGLPLQAADVGGPLGRKIIFDTRAGVVMVKRMQKIPPALTDNGVPVPCPPAY